MESATSQSQCSGASCEASNSKVLLLMAVFLSLLFGYFLVRKVIAYLKSKNRFRHSKNFSEDGRSSSEIQKGDKMQYSTYEGFAADTLETKHDAGNTESEKQPNYISENIDKITHFPTKLALKLQEYLMKTGIQEDDLENPSGVNYGSNKVQDNQISDNEKGQAKENEVDMNNEIFYSEENGTGTVRVISDLASPKDQNLRDHDELNAYS